MLVDVYKIDGTPSGEKVELDPAIFEIKPNDHAIYLVVNSIQANKRQGTHKVKPRNEVRGGGKKPYRQKKTGRARAGTTRSPLWVGGGSIFGPHPHDYVINVPVKVRKLARKSALSYKAKDGEIRIVEDFTFDSIKTKHVQSMLKSFSLYGTKTLLLTKAKDENVYKSGRNIHNFKVLEASKVSTYDLLNNNILLIQKSAVDLIASSLKN
jgi:large subunit ribosomal protein L4